MRKRIVLVLMAVFLCGAAPPAQAHMLWLNASSYDPQPGETVGIEIGWGHGDRFPRDAFISDGRIEQVYALDGEGEKTVLKKLFPSFYQFTPEADGAYRIVAVLSPGFLSITTDGHKRGSRKELANVVSCFRYVMDSEALIHVGSGGPRFPGINPGPLKILAMKNPSAVKARETLALKVMFKGKPLAGAKVSGTWAGRDGGKNNPWAIEEESDAEGMVRVKVDSAGQWLFRVAHKTPYPDKNEADDYSYRTSLTFTVR